MAERRFGTYNKFGTSNKFGASSGQDTLLYWGVEVDWDGDGVFTGSNEARYMTGIRGSRGRQGHVAQNGQGFESMGTGRYYITLDNTDGRYDAWNADSPLYPDVTYGKDVRITVRDAQGGTTYSVFYGVIEDIQPYNDIDGTRRVVITAVDGWQYLRSYTARHAIVEDVAPETAIGHVLDDVNWPARWGRSLGVSADNIPYWWADGNKQAASVLQDIADSFLGYFFLNAQGQAVYKTRNDVDGSAADLSSSVMLKDVTLPQPWVNSRNITRVKVHPRTLASTGVVWQLLGNVPTIENGASLTIWANYTYSNTSTPVLNVITPVATTDYTTNTAADGSGTDKTAQCSVSFTDFGDTAKLVITNSSGGTVYLTKLQVRGDALYEPNVADVTYEGAGATTMPRELRLDLIWQQDVNVASDFANVVGAFFAQQHPYPIVQVEARPSVQFAPDLFDFVNLALPTYGIDNESYRVAYIEHESVADNCQAVRTKFRLEPYNPGDQYWIWDTQSEFDTSTIFGA